MRQGGSYYSVGVEGGVMGRGAHDIVLDDRYANMEDAAPRNPREGPEAVQRYDLQPMPLARWESAA